jgi:preprotein translocase subunit SecD
MRRVIAMGMGKAGLSGLFLLCALVALIGVWNGSAGARVLAMTLQIAEAKVGTDQQTREPVLLLRLTEASKRRFADFTRDNIGRSAALIIDGRTVAKPMIRVPIEDGLVQIGGHFTRDETADIVRQLLLGAAKVQVQAVDG